MIGKHGILSVKHYISNILIEQGPCHFRLSLYEHQSTFNPNMPLRFLMYLADLYSKLVGGNNLYGTKKIMIPPPKFIVFYNGMEEEPDYQVLKLSDLYEIQNEPFSLELLVDMLNVNRGHNKELMDACKSLREYAEYIYRILRIYLRNVC